MRGKIRLILLFYRSYAFLSNLITAVCIWFIIATTVALLPALIFLKAAVLGLIYYIKREYGSRNIPCKSVRIDGKWVEHGYKHGVMYAPQHDFILLSRLLKNIVKDYKVDFDNLVSRFPIMEKYYSMPAAVLSEGERRIFEIWLILASDALFCLLDEPFSQVSPLHIEVIKTMIEEEKKTKGIVLSDHMYRDVAAVSDEVYVIENGTTYLTKSPDDMRKYGYIK